MNRGMTLIELLVATVTAAILAGVCAQVLLLGIKTYNYSSRQTASLTATRKVVTGDGSRTGVLAASRAAYSFSTIQTSSIAVLSTSAAVLTNYYVAKNALYRTTAGVSNLQAPAISALSLNYYMSTNGIISSTTLAASASMVTALVTVTTGTASNAKQAYALFSGAALRNH